MILSQKNLQCIHSENLVKPQNWIFNLPEKVLQFGTGVLLRGLPDYFIDKANRQGIFNGRVAIVKSTPGSTNEFDEQDCLYTLCVRGIEKGEVVSENIVSSAVSRVISADNDWNDIIEIAKSEHLKLIVSNTTEVGIQLVNESIAQNPPKSFPAKLLAVLYERFKFFKGFKDTGLVIIATELIPDNGKKLEEIVLELAKFNGLDNEFISWLSKENRFCNSLVDRIVPGKPDAQTLTNLQTELGYTDQLLSMTEPYRLWAIEGDSKVAETLSFAQVDEGVIIAPDIEIYRELKVRLLNGTHSLSSGIAFLSGIDTVKNAMQQELMKDYIDVLMTNEIGPAIPYHVSEQQVVAFAETVKDRFANPSIEHLWHNITFQYTMKMKIRILPLLVRHYELFDDVPAYIAFGFAAYLRFMKVASAKDGKYYGFYDGNQYLINDDSAAYFYEKSTNENDNYITSILKDIDFWKIDLNLMKGLVGAITEKYDSIVADGIENALQDLISSKTS